MRLGRDTLAYFSASSGVQKKSFVTLNVGDVIVSAPKADFKSILFLPFSNLNESALWPVLYIFYDHKLRS